MDPVNPTTIKTVVDDAPESAPSRPWSGIVWFVLALGAVWVTVVFGTEIGVWWADLTSVLDSPESFRAWVEGFGAWGSLVYLLAQAAQVIVVPIPGALFPPVGALAFGPWAALGLSLAGMALGSAAVFLVSRRWGRPLAVRLVGADRVLRYENLMTARGGLLLWLVFVLPLLPDDAMCALAGVSGISFRRFMVIATVGRLPAVTAGVFAMAGLESAPAWVWALAASVFALILWTGLRYGPHLERRLVSRMGRDVGGRRSDRGRSGEPGETLARPAGEANRSNSAPLMAVVVATTLAAAALGFLAGVSGVTTAAILVWGVILTVVVASARDAD